MLDFASVVGGLPAPVLKESGSESFATAVVGGLPAGSYTAATEGGAEEYIGTITDSLSPVTCSLVGAVEVTGVIIDSIGPLDSQITGAAQVSGAVADVLSEVESAIAGTVGVAGILADALSEVQGAITGTVEVTGAVADALGPLEVALQGEAAVSGVITDDLPTINEVIVGTTGTGGDIIVGHVVDSIGSLDEEINGAVAVHAVIVSALPEPEFVIGGDVAVTGNIVDALASPEWRLVGGTTSASVAVLALQAGSQSVIVMYGSAGLRQSAVCVVAVMDLTGTVVAQVTDAGGGAVRTVVVPGLEPATDYFATVACGGVTSPTAALRTMAVSSEVSGVSVSFRPPARLAAGVIEVAYGPNFSLMVVGVADAEGRFPVVIPGQTVGSVVQFRWRWLAAGGAAQSGWSQPRFVVVTL